MQDFDVVGDDEMVLGAPLAIGRGAMGRQAPPNGQRMMATMQVRQPGWMHGTPQGVSLPAEEMDVLPFDTLVITAGGAGAFVIPAAGITANPQRPFRGERLIMSATTISGGTVTDVTALSFINGAIFVGAVQVGAAQGGMPMSAFGPNAFGVRMSWPRAGQGTRISIPISTTAASGGAGDQLVVTAVCFGRAVR